MSSSYLIDGIGDEVTVLLGVLVAVFVVIVSWLSTRVSDSSGTTESFQNSQQTSATVENQTHSASAQPNVPTEAVQTEESSSNSDASGSTQDESVVSNSSPNDAPVLRHRILHDAQASAQTPPTQESPTSSTAEGGASITIRLKFMDETIQTVKANPDETLENFMSRQFTSDTRNRYRLIYRGQVLRDQSRTLRQFNLVGDTTGENPTIPMIHCFLSPATPVNEAGVNMASSASQQMQMVAEELHIGSFMLPILGFALASLWYLCIFHTSLFSIQSIVSIVGFSFLYIALIVNHVI
uniref:transmembrane and ubiquitin-like domain-containing protein 1 n=1 Tax=Styela clava TaxID=7725 RepID=UPI00193A4B33|nr:transmembrane and ubiquitin-like domain-containing protein 1 [Styela clava]